MKTTRTLKIVSRILFFCSVFFITVFFADWFSGPFFFNRNYRAIKYILSFFAPALVTVFNYAAEKSFRFIGKTTAVIMSAFVVGLIIFNILKMPAFSVNEVSSLFHLTYALVCVFTVLLVCTVIALIDKSRASGFGEFYNDFFSGYVPVFITLYILFYALYRYGGIEYGVNLIPFRGEIKTVFENSEPLSVLKTFGNIAFYSTLALTAPRFFTKRGTALAVIIPFAISVATEIVQGLFSVGDADIDDVILNTLGAVIGAIIYKFIIENLRRDEECLE